MGLSMTVFVELLVVDHSAWTAICLSRSDDHPTSPGDRVIDRDFLQNT